MKTATVVAAALSFTIAHAADLLPSWNDTAPKQAIIAFVEKVSKPGSPRKESKDSPCQLAGDGADAVSVVGAEVVDSIFRPGSESAPGRRGGSERG